MGNADYEIDQPFEAALRSVIKEIAWEQLFSVAILIVVLTLFNYVTGKRLKFSAVVSISIAGSFFLWPHINLIYLHLTNPKIFQDASMFHGLYGNSRPMGKLLGILVLIPFLMNQMSLLLLLFVMPLAMAAESLRSYLRWFGYICLFALLPLAWFIDCFNEAPR